MIGPYGTGQVYLGDAVALMRALPDRSVPVILTDPPYGTGQHFQRTENQRTIENDGAADAWTTLVAFTQEAARVITGDGVLVVCCPVRGSRHDSRAWTWMQLFDTPPWSLYWPVVWHRTLGLSDQNVGYRRSYEFVLVSMLTTCAQVRWDWSGRRGHEVSDVVELSSDRVSELGHPTPKPVELMEHFLRIHSRPGDLVLDPFSGGGTTGVACKRLGREFLGFEIDPHWAEYSNRCIGATPSHADTPLFQGGLLD